MASYPLGSILLGSSDPQRLRSWYLDALQPRQTHDGFLDFGGVGILIDGRTDVAATAAEPGRFILNFHVDDARATAARLDEMGVSWVVKVEEREHGLFGTLVDPDGNYLQIIELSPDYLAAQGG
jgi:predicted enzyme related to lactoylglutathione lyase